MTSEARRQQERKLHQKSLPIATFLLFLFTSTPRSLCFAAAKDTEATFDVFIGYKSEFASASSSSSSSFGDNAVRFRFNLTNTVAATVTTSQWTALQQDPNVDYVEEDAVAVMHTFTAVTPPPTAVQPIGSSFTTTIGSTAEIMPWGITAVQGDDPTVPPADLNSDCFKVCLVDSGLDVSHPDIPYTLDGTNIEGHQFGLPNDQFWYNPTIMSTHGTHVAGTLLAAANNAIGVAGVVGNNQNICLIVNRVFPDGTTDQALSYIELATEDCAMRGARVINMSLGSQINTQTARRLHEQLYNQGVLVIASAGNENTDVPNYPAGYDQVISVTAVDQTLAKADFSNYGSTIDISAPGVSVISTIIGANVRDDFGRDFSATLMEFSRVSGSWFNLGLMDCGFALSTCQNAYGKACLIERGDALFRDKAKNCENGGGVMAFIYNNETGPYDGTLTEYNDVNIPTFSLAGEYGLDLLGATTVSVSVGVATYGSMKGTSMAAPHVSGAAAKIWAARPGCTNVQVRQALLSTARYLGDSFYFGNGLVQTRAAYEYLLQQDPPCGFGANFDSGTTANTTANDVPGYPPKVEPKQVDRTSLYDTIIGNGNRYLRRKAAQLPRGKHKDQS